MSETEVTTSVEEPVESKNNEKRMEKDVTENEKLILTQSEQDLGIKIIQPTNRKTIDTMIRLYAVPSEKLRVWTCWLTKVGERATDDWQWWLRAQIRLALRISDLLQRGSVVTVVEETEKSDQEEEELSMKEKADVNIESNAAQDEQISPEPELTMNEEVSFEESQTDEKNRIEGDPSNLLSSENELDKEQPSVEVADAERSREKGDKNRGNKGKKTKGSKPDKLEPKIMYEKGFWPVGVRWKPFSQRGKRKPPSERQPEEIPIPQNEEEMMDLIRKIRHQGVIYRSLYKHWSETAEQAVKEIFGRMVLPTKQVCLKGEEIPYSFFLGSEPDLEYAIEHDDEEILLADPGRERITRDFEHLYFNLSDKPGKGGKPWL